LRGGGRMCAVFIIKRLNYFMCSVQMTIFVKDCIK